MENQASLLSYLLLIINLILIWYLLRGKNLKIHEQTQNKLNFTIQPKLLRFIGLFFGQCRNWWNPIGCIPVFILPAIINK